MRHTREGPASVEEYRELGRTLLGEGAPLLAYDALREGLSRFPADARLRQLTALALARTGASRLANQMLERLVAEGHDDEETLGLLARTHKDLWAASADPSARQRHLDRAYACYLEAHERSGGYWSGINASTLALLRGDESAARALALRVRELCLERRASATPSTDDYWILATLGEAALVVREWSEAEAWYSQAAAVAGRRLGDLASTRRNARLILRHLEADASGIESCLRVPPVVVFTGHLIDRPGRPQPRFPASLEADVRSALQGWLRDAGAGFGYASAACGSDILFLECLAEAGAEAHVVLPYDRHQFLADSVDVVPGSDWPERFRRVLAGAAEVITASDRRMADGAVSHEYGFLVLDGTAGVRADELDTELRCLAVWDGRPGDGPGGTASAVAWWRANGRRVDVIDLAEALRRHHLPVPVRDAGRAATAAPVPGSAARPFAPEIVGLLFADARGFSQLDDEAVPRFVAHFLGLLAEELARSSHAPLLVNTWGDGLYVVFRSVRETGEVALRLCEAVRETDWPARGLPADLSLRIALHAGPAYACLDPVTKRRNYLGAHVTLAARIEPVTPPGEVYASGAFAALARAAHPEQFICAYTGHIPLAKSHGTIPTYVVHRRHGS